MTSDLMLRLAALPADQRAALMSRLRAERRPDERAPDAPVPASLAQARLWFLQQLDPADPAYNLVAGLRLEGPLDRGVLESTLGEILRRHEALRTAFRPVEGAPIQEVVPPAPVELPVTDLKQSDAEERERRLHALCVEEGRRPFDLERAPLIRFRLVRTAPQDHLLILVVHHLVADGWSLGVVAREFGLLHQAFSEGRPSPLPELPIRYRDYTLRQQERLRGQAFEAHLAFWRQLLAGQLPVLSLPTDRARPPVQTFNGRLHPFELDADVTAALKERAARAGHTPFARLLSAFAVLLASLSGQDDLIVGIPVAGRNHLETEGMVGFFVDTLALRLDLSGSPSHDGLAQRVHQRVLQCLAHQEVPFDRLVQELHLPRDPSRPVLRQVAFAYQTVPPPVVRLGDLVVRTVSPMEIDLGVARLDLTLSMWEQEGRLRGAFEYNADLFDASTVARWAEQLRDVVWRAAEAGGRRVHVPSLAERTNLTAGQLLFWFGMRYRPEVQLYFEHVTTLFTIRAALDGEHFRHAFQRLVDDSDSLRSVFREVDWVPRREVREHIQFSLEVVDLAGSPDPEAQVRSWVAERARSGLDLRERPFDSALLRLGPEHFVWYLNVHHLVSDAWSTAVIVRLISEYYERSREGRLEQAPRPPPYQDYFLHERDLRASERYRRAGAYWRDKLAQPTNRMAFYGRAGAEPSSRTARVSLDLGAERTRRILEVTRREGFVSPAVVLCAALFAYLGRVSGERLLRVGTPFANRPATFRDTIGLFMNACPLQVRLDVDEDFRTLARRVQLELVESGRHQPYPVRNPAHDPVYDVYFNFQNARFAGFGGPLRMELIGTEHSNDRLALQVGSFDASDRFAADFDFNVVDFDEGERERSAAHYVSLLDALLEDLGTKVVHAPMLSEAEERWLLDDLNRTSRRYPLDVPLHEWIERQVGQTPGATAVTFEGRRLTYRELNAAANRLARRLRQAGIGAGGVAAVFMERCPEMVVALLGILKAGGAYLPVEPSYPRERVAFMLRDSASGVVLVQERLRALLPPGDSAVICLDAEEEVSGAEEDGENLGVQVEPDWTAYVMYTSGSTGRPKAVQVPHRGICNRLLWMLEAYGIGRADAVIQKTPFTFDVSVWEFFWPLMTGARLVAARPDGHRDPAYLADLIVNEQVTVAHFVPSMLRVFLDSPKTQACTSLRLVVCSGEALAPELRRRFLELLDAGLHNLYGPTEASVDVTSWDCRSQPDLLVVPIGRPIANTQLYVLDAHLEPVPAGIPGQLHIGGVSLALGYLNRPGLTAEKFIPNPFGREPGGRLYRTGDLVRYRPDGSLEFLGRIDNQVKLRGFRIELGEIEAELGQHPRVREAAVVLRKDRDGEGSLVGYVACHEPAPAPGELRRFLAERLPEHMVPASFVTLAALPLSSNGKVDRKALPPLSESPWERRAGFVAPRMPLEESIARLWAEELGRERVGVRDDFFELGGHSLLAARLVSRLGAQLGVDVPLAAIFQAPTVETMAALLSGGAKAPRRQGLLVAIQAAGDRPPLFALHPAGGEVMVYQHLSSILGKEQPFIGVQSRALGGAYPEHGRIEDMAAEYARAIEQRSDGPYHLLGWSMGGAIAVGVARLLEERGQRVAFLGLLDAHLPESDADRDPLLVPAIALVGAVSTVLETVDTGDLAYVRQRLQGLPLAERLRAVVDWAGERALLPSGFSLAAAQQRAELAALHEELLLTYRPPSVKAPLRVWWARQDIRWRPHRTDWRGDTGGDVWEETVDGNHFTLLRPPHATALGERLRAALDLASRSTADPEAVR